MREMHIRTSQKKNLQEMKNMAKELASQKRNWIRDGDENKKWKCINV